MSYGDPRYGYRRNDGAGMALAVRMIPILIGLVVIGSTMIRGCQRGPFGRAQIVAIKPEQEAQLGLQAFQETLSNARVIRKGPAVEAVRTVAERLIRATKNEKFRELIGTPIPKFEWELEVVDDKQVNAFCLPGGKMVVYTAILPVAETDAGLATVIGHEISHALAHHGAERMAQQQMVQVGLSSAGASMGDMDPRTRQQLLSILNAGTKFGIILSYSRKHESEADHMGLLLMAAAGYDPEETIRFWERMSSATGGGQAPPEFMSTHPNHQTRIHDLKSWMPTALSLYENSPTKSTTEVLPALR